jgi:hypothetical protein
LSKRLKGLGYEVERINGHTGTVIYYTKPSPKCPDPLSLYPLPPEYQENDPTSRRLSFAVHSPFHSPSIPLFDPTNTRAGNVGIVGNEKSEQSLDGVEREHQPPTTIPKVVSLMANAQVVNTPLGLAQTLPLPYGMTRIEKIG